MAWVPAAISAGGSLLETFSSNSSSKKEAQRNRDFQERMSNTAHQREVMDLKAAGLNPMISAMKGNGASTPSGSVAQISKPDAARSALEAYNARSLVKAQVDQAAATAEQARTQAQVNRETAGSIAAAKAAEIGMHNASAASLTAGLDKIGAEVREINARIQNIFEETKGRDLSNRAFTQLNDLAVRLKQLEISRNKALLPEAEARGKAGAKVGRGIDQLDPLGKGIGESAGAIHEWVADKWEKYKRWRSLPQGHPDKRLVK